MTKLLSAAMLAALTGSASAQIGVTEIFAGIQGPDPTNDWFEITNFGSAGFGTSSLFYDDDSADPTVNDQIFGLSGIAPGESVLVVVEGGAAAANVLRSFFGLASGLQIGWIDNGAGLGNGDAVNLFDSNLAGATLLATAEGTNPDTGPTTIFNPVTGVFGELAQVGVFGAFATPFTNTSGTFNIVASPGVVPAPASAALLGLAGLTAVRRRR
jgi:hypothetical protein